MTKTFERFLRSFTDEELAAFAQERARVRPPYWKALQLALAVEASRRGLTLDDGDSGTPSPEGPAPASRRATA